MKAQKNKLEQVERLINRICLVLWATIVIGRFCNCFSLLALFILEVITGLLVFVDIKVINKITAERHHKQNI